MSKHVTANSYVRFSARKQSKGDSYRRQTERAAAYCERRGWTLSDKSYEDLGVSAFKGKNALVGNLGEFLKAVQAGAIKPGSALIVESLDRISRQGIDEGYDLIKRILKAGIVLVTLTPEREFDTTATRSLSKGALEIQLILERAAEESEMKSARCGAAWGRKKANARAMMPGSVVTPTLPAWCRLDRSGKIVLDTTKAAAVREIFRLAASGYGAFAIAKKLTEDKVAPIGRKPRWIKGYVVKLISDRRVLGEYQPTKGPARKPDGPAIVSYFPSVVSEQEWYAARAGAEERRRRPGRAASGNMNLFAGILQDARDGSNMILMARPNRGGKLTRVLASARAESGNGKCVSFPQAVFEEAILSRLAELDPAEIVGASTAGEAVSALEGEQTEVRATIAKLEAVLLDGDIAAVGRQLRGLEDREKELTKRLEKARAEATRPLESSWQEAQSLIEAVTAAADEDIKPLRERKALMTIRLDRRFRLRSALRRIIQAAYALITIRRLDRLAAVQLYFRDGGHRDYLIYHRPQHCHFGGRLTEAHTWVGSLTDTEADRPGTLDLRKHEHVARLEAVLEALDLEKLPAAMEASARKRVK